MPMNPSELVALARRSDVTTAQLRADVDALRAKLERLGGPTCPNCRFPAMGPLWWSPRCGAHVCAQCALVHQGEGDQAERLAMLRAAVQRYLAARDAAQPEAEKAARDEIERML